jgi:hypothetical protein
MKAGILLIGFGLGFGSVLSVGFVERALEHMEFAQRMNYADITNLQYALNVSLIVGAAALAAIMGVVFNGKASENIWTRKKACILGIAAFLLGMIAGGVVVPMRW